MTTRVLLPTPEHNVGMVQLRWRLVTDSTVPSVGWWIDSVTVGPRARFLHTQADFDGDGIDDLVLGPGPGGGPHVRVVSGRTGAPILDFFAYAPGFTGGVHVATCDLNGDGVPDIVTGPGPGGGAHVRAFDGRTGLPLSALFPPAGFFAYNAAFAGGVFVGCRSTVHPLNAVVSDIVTTAGPGGGPHVRVFRSFDTVELLGFFGYAPGFTGGVFVAP